MKNKIDFRSESGQGLVEFALVIPVFLLIVGLIIEVGWITFNKAAFTYGYTHSTWELTENMLAGRTDPFDEGTFIKLEETADKQNRKYADTPLAKANVEKVLSERIGENTLLFQPSWFNITVNDAYCKNDEPIIFEVPVPDGVNKTNNEGKKITRKLYLKCEVTYEIPTITFWGKIMFPSGVCVAKGDINANRVLASANVTK